MTYTLGLVAIITLLMMFIIMAIALVWKHKTHKVTYILTLTQEQDDRLEELRISLGKESVEETINQSISLLSSLDLISRDNPEMLKEITLLLQETQQEAP